MDKVVKTLCYGVTITVGVIFCLIYGVPGYIFTPRGYSLVQREKIAAKRIIRSVLFIFLIMTAILSWFGYDVKKEARSKMALFLAKLHFLQSCRFTARAPSYDRYIGKMESLVDSPWFMIGTKTVFGIFILSLVITDTIVCAIRNMAQKLRNTQ